MVKVAEEAGSDKHELKRFLKLAVDKPVHMAFALGGDGRAIVKLDKLKQPRALEKHLREAASDARNHRFGSVMIDPDDAKLVRFIVNKEIGGFARKLVLALKGTGFHKVHITLEDGTSVEQHEGERDEEEGDQAPEAPAAHAAVHDAPLLDAGTLTAQLTGLVKQMMAVIAKDPSQKSGLAELATDAQANLKRGDLEQAAAGLEILRDAIGVAGPAGNGTASAAAPSPDAQKAQKSRAAWTATRSKIDAELEKLGRAILAASDGEDMGADLDGRFRAAVEPVLSTLDESLADTLARASETTDPAERRQLLQQARETIDRCTSFVAGSKIITDLDGNPFMQLTIGKTLTGTLAALSAAIR